MSFLIGAALKLPRIQSKWSLSFSSWASSRRFHHLAQSPPEFDMGDAGEKLDDYTVVKEGEAEILLHSSNSVFYNNAQVNNRDMSIAILRTFLTKSKEEHAAMLSRKADLESNMSEDIHSRPVLEESNIVQDEEPNEDCEMKLNHKTFTSKVKEEFKAPRVLEALAASGLRSVRYAREVDGLGQIVALDYDKVSIEACKRNIQFNSSVASSKVEAHLVDARVYMLTHPKEFDVVDLDPYGSPSVFLDSAVQTIADGGILMCTATDLAVLCGGNAAVCYSKYGSYPLKGKYCHEMALRILLACIEAHANRHKRYIVPILSVYMDFYIRVFVRIFTSASAVKNTPIKLSYVYQCVGCDSFHLQSLGRTSIKNTSVTHAPGFGPVVPQECSNCGKKFNMGGPIWAAPIHDQEWVASTLANVETMKDRYPAYKKISAVLATALEELPDVPLFVSLHNLSATLKCTSPPAAMFRFALMNAGYRVSGSHVNPLALKTDAPMDVIWDIMRCWVNKHPVKARPANQPGTVILSKEPILRANFAQAVTPSRKTQPDKVRRFLPNPERNWGPKIRGGRQIKSKHASTLGQETVDGLVCHEKRNGESHLVALESDEPAGDKGDEPDAKCRKDLVMGPLPVMMAKG